MKKIKLIVLYLLLIVPISLFAVEKGKFFGAKPVALPNWFKQSFLDLEDDLAEADENNRHIIIYVHQNGCPYCAKLITENFQNPELVKKIQSNFDVIEINMWGDRDISNWQGRDYTEKTFAQHMKVQFTPTLLFLNNNGDIILRLNGYQSIEDMYLSLDYVANKKYSFLSFAEYKNNLKKSNKGKLNSSNIFESPPYDLTQESKNYEFLAVFFENPNCAACDKFHNTLFITNNSKKSFAKMRVVQLNLEADTDIISPKGEKTTAKKWYENLNLTYSPAIVFFNKSGDEIIRKDAFFKSFHYHSILSYVITKEYENEPSFQRYIEHKADKLREQGFDVNIW